MDKETLKMLANKLMFTMEESEYDTLLEEFDCKFCHILF